jgi:hypothetical protein
VTVSLPVTGQEELAGSEVSSFLALSTAAQKFVAGHDREVIAPAVSTRTGADHANGAAMEADGLERSTNDMKTRIAGNGVVRSG